MIRLLPLFFLLTLCFSCDSPDANIDKTAATTPQSIIPAIPAPEFSTTVIDAEPASPRKEMKGQLGQANVTVNYGSPAVKARTIWGSLVPFDEVWRCGANEATRFTVDQSVQIGNQELSAGTYGLFLVPHKDQWEVIFNKVADQWGAYEYDASQDVLRITTEAITTDSLYEYLEYELAPEQVVLAWEHLRVPIPCTTEKM